MKIVGRIFLLSVSLMMSRKARLKAYSQVLFHQKSLMFKNIGKLMTGVEIEEE